MIPSPITLVLVVLRAIELAVIAVVVTGWLGVDRNHRVVNALHRVVDPLLERVRPLARHIPPPSVDWSPLLVVLALQAMRALLGA